ncbi:hypothetical protein DICPUDRAFT_88361 [Dictyostelium purpureum]|uniref:alpha-L-fucosidase n=1 Tax=Dictyostelium purpureum TaxID=5786 RepID=F0ZNY3_DICPU|nr:uncharacterized protein DICPUDRAFT_88361 [Dictyostelium purpureum]EGC34344.1 hypothetical protein DICPUDRAFT_88361 [Dictyostelium purpureum]|eukprot:XP_003289137.1 hypothetical protein DICPUDRAFT_88361 [Dictyostelium purpureum]
MKLLISVLLSLFLNVINVNSQIYTSNWTSINSRPLPSWYDSVKFGIFIHFGVYSVPAYSDGGYAEWYWWNLESGDDNNSTKQWHGEHFGPNFKYQDFAPMFNCRDFNANDWASIIDKSGAKYVVLTSKHHEGYTLWPSEQSWGWNSVDVGPNRDIVAELTKAVKNLGLHMGLYHSLFEWFNPFYLSDKSSGNPPTKEEYVDTVLMPQLMDIVNSYEPHVIWADGDWEQASDYWKSTDFLSWLYTNSSVKDVVVVNDRWGHGCRNTNGGFFTGSDAWLPNKLIDHKWENCETIGFSYGYDQFEPAKAYTNSTILIQKFSQTVSCGGNFLLDIGPDAEGTIPINMQNTLLDIGYWLQINGESIYDSSPWRVQNQTSSIWYTTNKSNGAIYALVFEYPESGQLLLNDPICNSNSQVNLLGFKSASKITIQLPKSNDQPGITLNLPFASPQDYPPFVYVFKLVGCN